MPIPDGAERIVGVLMLAEKKFEEPYSAADRRFLQLDRVVAVKVILSRAFGQQNSLRRFGREARAAARLNHPNTSGCTIPEGFRVRGPTWCRSNYRGNIVS